MALGLALAVPIWLSGLKSGAAMRFNVLIAVHTFIQCYFGSELFFETFGMEYHFHTSRLWNGTPVHTSLSKPFTPATALFFPFLRMPRALSCGNSRLTWVIHSRWYAPRKGSKKNPPS